VAMIMNSYGNSHILTSHHSFAKSALGGSVYFCYRIVCVCVCVCVCVYTCITYVVGT